jgi:hypothetical protein
MLIMLQKNNVSMRLNIRKMIAAIKLFDHCENANTMSIYECPQGY